MKKVKYISGYVHYLRHNKVYDVIDIKDNKILIENDLGNEVWYYIKIILTNEMLFEDVTTQYRTDVIDSILR